MQKTNLPEDGSINSLLRKLFIFKELYEIYDLKNTGKRGAIEN